MNLNPYVDLAVRLDEIGLSREQIFQIPASALSDVIRGKILLILIEVPCTCGVPGHRNFHATAVKRTKLPLARLFAR